MAGLPPTPFDDLDATAVLTAAEVAARMRVDARSVRRAIARGDLRASRACGLRILAGDAATWWRSHQSARQSPERVAPAVEPAPPRRARGARAPVRARRSSRLPLPPRAEDLA